MGSAITMLIAAKCTGISGETEIIGNNPDNLLNNKNSRLQAANAAL